MVSIFMPKNEQANFTPPPAGTHLAVCYRIIDLGTQLIDFKGQSKQQHKIMLSWELPYEEMEPGKPFTIHKTYTFSSNDKANFRKHLEAWRGKKFADEEFGTFDIAKLIGKGCLIGIVHDPKDGGGIYANISAVMKLAKGQETPPLVNPPVVFSLAPDGFDQNVFDALPNGAREKILKSPEYAEIMGIKPLDHSQPDESYTGSHNDEMSEEIPF